MDNQQSPAFCIGHHDSKRTLPITSETIQTAYNANYDMLTCPITTQVFHSHVLALLSDVLSGSYSKEGSDRSASSLSPSISIPALSPADTALTPDDTISHIIGISSAWIDLSSPDPLIAEISMQVLTLEIKYAAFCGLSCVIIPGPKIDNSAIDHEGLARYSRAIADALSDGPFISIYIWLPMTVSHADRNDVMGDLRPHVRKEYLRKSTSHDDNHGLLDSWEMWDNIRSTCKYHSRLSVALMIPKMLPPMSVQSRWYSEPVRILTLDANTFVPNAKGYPVVSRSHQAFVSRCVRSRVVPWFLLCDVELLTADNPLSTLSTGNEVNNNSTAFPTPAEASGVKTLRDPYPHISYMRNLQAKQPLLTAVDKFSAGYQDYLQAPLQPLTVNLESITYEVFEKDPVKYDWYEKAIARALHDWIEQGKPTSNPDGRVVVAVVGAGRGPLVTRALKASEDVGIDIDMWALEKNPNAFVLLQRHNATIWNGQVNLVHSDMRTWQGPCHWKNPTETKRIYNVDMEYDDDQDESQQDQTADHEPSSQDLTLADSTPKHVGPIQNFSLPSNYDRGGGRVKSPTFYKIDILISELLGSFADNELSPECLDGVQHLMNSDDGISIPSSYTAFLTPISAPKLYSDISNSMTNANSNAAEIPYVVLLNAIDYLSIVHDGSDSNGKDSIELHKQQKPQNHEPKQAQNQHAATSTPLIHPVWSFNHPNLSLSMPTSLSSTSTVPITSIANAHNKRHTTMTFPIPNRGICHGLAGYFEATLYDGVELSTNPNTMDAKSENMISWFPIYFPLKNPLVLPDDSTLIVNMWRQTDDRKVWYEWLVDTYLDIPLLPAQSLSQPQQQSRPVQPTRPSLPPSSSHYHNATTAISGTGEVDMSDSGNNTKERDEQNDDNHRTRSSVPSCKTKRIRIGGSELHSSEKEGCLM